MHGVESIEGEGVAIVFWRRFGRSFLENGC